MYRNIMAEELKKNLNPDLSVRVANLYNGIFLDTDNEERKLKISLLYLNDYIQPKRFFFILANRIKRCCRKYCIDRLLDYSELTLQGKPMIESLNLINDLVEGRGFNVYKLGEEYRAVESNIGNDDDNTKELKRYITVIKNLTDENKNHEECYATALAALHDVTMSMGRLWIERENDYRIYEVIKKAQQNKPLLGSGLKDEVETIFEEKEEKENRLVKKIQEGDKLPGGEGFMAYTNALWDKVYKISTRSIIRTALFEAFALATLPLGLYPWVKTTMKLSIAAFIVPAVQRKVNQRLLNETYTLEEDSKMYNDVEDEVRMRERRERLDRIPTIMMQDTIEITA